MPSVIVFNALGAAASENWGDDRIKVTEDAETVIKELAQSKTAFAAFHPTGNPVDTVWINRETVRLVRAVDM